MNYRMMGRLIGWILLAESLFMLPAVAICLYDGDTEVARAFLITIGVTAFAAGSLILIGRGAKKGFYAREGLVCVGISWLLLSLFGCLPFYISRQIPSFINALFETVSGFTTTGSTILRDVEALTRGALYWRSFTHWLGGMGVLVFIMAVLPAGGRKGDSGSMVHLLRAESTGPQVDKLVSRMQDTAKILYVLYILLTVLCFGFLMAGGMSLFESLCTAFGTAGTGGFGVKNSSIADYSPYIQWVVTVFMLLFGVNFGCYYLLLMRKIRTLLGDEELRTYIGIVAVSIGLVVWNLWDRFDSFGENLRHASFQVASIVTTTGFSTVDFNQWPSFSKAILLCLMLVGASAGSTGGGFKVGRILLLCKSFGRNLRQVLHPRRVQVVRLSGRTVDEQVLAGTSLYFVTYIFLILLSFLLLSLDDFGTTTNFTAVVACINNIGPGLDKVGPVGNFADYSILSKLVLIFDMLAGRLEIFPVLVLFSRTTWSRK